MSFRSKFQPRGSQGFTLVEIMVTVAILAIVLTTGIPPMAKALQRKGMSKAIRDVVEGCEKARQKAVISQSKTALVINPREGTIHVGDFSGQIPPNVNIISLGVNFSEYSQEDEASVGFYPNGTSDEFNLTMQGENGEIHTVYLDIVTGSPEVVDGIPKEH